VEPGGDGGDEVFGGRVVHELGLGLEAGHGDSLENKIAQV
jgi:asparagine synthetase B (glutamine-hydrolysing)